MANPTSPIDLSAGWVDSPKPAPIDLSAGWVDDKSMSGTKPPEINRAAWDKRADGSAKGDGFLGVLKRPDGSVSSEISVSTDAFGGKEFPLLVPTLTKDEVNTLLNLDVQHGAKPPRAIIQKAEAYARARQEKGLPLFAQPGEQNAQLYPQFTRAQEQSKPAAHPPVAEADKPWLLGESSRQWATAGTSNNLPAAPAPQPSVSPAEDAARSSAENARLQAERKKQADLLDQQIAARIAAYGKEEHKSTFHAAPQGAMTMQMATDPSNIVNDPELQKLYHAKAQLGIASTYDQSNAGVAQGLKREWGTAKLEGKLPFAGAAIEAKNMMEVYQIGKKMEAGQPLTPGEEALGKAYALRMSAEEAYHPGFLEKVSDFASQMPTFAAELGLSGGLFNAGRAATQKFGAKMLRKVVSEAVADNLANLAEQGGKAGLKGAGSKLVADATGSIGGGLAQSYALAPRAVPQALEEAAPQYRFHDDPGAQKVVLQLDHAGSDFDQALVRAVGENAFMGAVMHAGKYLAEPIDAMKPQFLAKWLEQKGYTALTEAAAKKAEKLGWDGIVGQVIEQNVMKAYNNVVSGRDVSEGFTPEQLAVEFLGNMVVGAGMVGAPSVAGHFVEARATREQTKIFDQMSERAYQKPYSDLSNDQKGQVLWVAANTIARSPVEHDTMVRAALHLGFQPTDGQIASATWRKATTYKHINYTSPERGEANQYLNEQLQRVRTAAQKADQTIAQAPEKAGRENTFEPPPVLNAAPAPQGPAETLVGADRASEIKQQLADENAQAEGEKARVADQQAEAAQNDTGLKVVDKRRVKPEEPPPVAAEAPEPPPPPTDWRELERARTEYEKTKSHLDTIAQAHGYTDFSSMAKLVNGRLARGEKVPEAIKKSVEWQGVLAEAYHHWQEKLGPVEPNRLVPPPVEATETPTKQETYKFGSTQVNVPEETAVHIQNLANSIPEEHLAGKGREDQPHITVRYGLKGDNFEAVKALLEKQAPFTATLGKTDIFPPSESSDSAAVVYAAVKSPAMAKLHHLIGDTVPVKESSFGEYKPHATIAYVKPEVAESYKGRKDVEGQQFTVSKIAITDRQGNQHEVELKGTPEQSMSGTQKASEPPAPLGEEDALTKYAQVAKAGDDAVAARMMAEMFAAEQKPAPQSAPPPDLGSKNKVFTDARLAESLKALKEEGLETLYQENHLPSAKALKALMGVAGHFYEQGVRNRGEWEKAVLGRTGEWAKPFLRSTYDGIRIALKDSKDYGQEAAPQKAGAAPENKPRQKSKAASEQPLGEKLPAINGKDTEVLIPDKAPIPAYYAVVPGDSLTPSHDPLNNWQQNDNAFQPRTAYGTDSGVQQDIVDRAHAIEPRKIINTDPGPTGGPSVVRSDGKIAGGNKRAMIQLLAYKLGHGERLRNYLVEHAHEFGIDQKSIPPVEQKPILVRVMKHDLTDREAMFRVGDDLNTTETAAYSEEETAAAAGKRLPQETFNKIADQLAANDWSLRDLMRERNDDVTSLMLESGLIEPNKKTKYVDGTTGKLTEDGKNLFEAAVLGKVIPDAELIGDARRKIPAVLNKVDRAMAALARIRSRNDEWDITDLVQDALRLHLMIDSVGIGKLREAAADFNPSRDSTVDLYLHPEKFKGTTQQMDYGEGTIRPKVQLAVEAMAKLLEDNSGEVKRALDDYAKAAQAGDEGPQGGFGFYEPPTPLEAFNAHIAKPNGITLEKWGEVAKKVGPPPNLGEKKLAPPPTEERPRRNAINSSALEDSLSPEAQKKLGELFKQRTNGRALREIRAAMEVYERLLHPGDYDKIEKPAAKEAAALRDAMESLLTGKGEGYKVQIAVDEGLQKLTGEENPDWNNELLENEVFASARDAGEMIFHTLDPKTASFDLGEFNTAFGDVEFRREPDEVFPKPKQVVDLLPPSAKKATPFIPLEEAKKRIAAWKETAKRIGKTEDNSRKIVYSLFDESGIISKPWEEAGYTVRRFDIKKGEDLTDFGNWMEQIENDISEGYEVEGVFAQPPCTSFTLSGTRWWGTQHDVPNKEMVRKKYGDTAAELFDKPLDYANTLVATAKLFIAQADPRWYAMENPAYGRINTQNGLPKAVLGFNPNNYGDPYTKQTQLWGEFNPNLPLANIEPTEGSKAHKLTGFNEKDKAERSKTAEGFAYSFFMANHGEEGTATKLAAPPTEKLAPPPKESMSGTKKESAPKTVGAAPALEPPPTSESKNESPAQYTPEEKLTATRLRQQLDETFKARNLPAHATDMAMAVIEANAKYRGMSLDDYAAKYLGGVTDKDVVGKALFQAMPDKFTQMLKEAGAEPVGLQVFDRKYGLQDLVYFNDPAHQSTMALPAEGLTVEKIRAHMEEFRAGRSRGASANKLYQEMSPAHALSPEAIKKENDWFQQAKQELGPEAKLSDVMLRAQELKEQARIAPPFYHQTEKILSDPKLMNAGSGEQWLATLRNKGVKEDEIKWTGLDDFLKDKPKVSKQEVQDFIRENNVQVKEVKLGGDNKKSLAWAEFDGPSVGGKPGNHVWTTNIGSRQFSIEKVGDLYHANAERGLTEQFSSVEAAKRWIDEVRKESGDGTKFAQYQMPGGKNYREIVLSLPYEKKGLVMRDGETAVDALDRMHAENPAPLADRDTHFPEINNKIGWLRVNDRVDADGKKVLFVEEFQENKAIKDYRQYQKKLKEGKQLTPDEQADLKNIEANVPFLKTWHELLVKRALRYAAENGYDKLAWTPGEVQNDRYDLSKHIDRLVVDRNGDKFDVTGMKDGAEVVAKDGIPASELADTVGKDVAERIVGNQSGHQVLTGLDLKVGGSGMKGFYDKIIPDFLNKYGKKWGAKVGETQIAGNKGFSEYKTTGDFETARDWLAAGNELWYKLEDGDFTQVEGLHELEDYRERYTDGGADDVDREMHLVPREGGNIQPRTVPSIPITAEMKKSVMEEGQPLFQNARAPKGATSFLEDGRAVVHILKNGDPSTVVHELFHVFRRSMKPEDAAIAEKWAGVENGEWTVAAEEKFARGAERYFYEGKSPTEALKAAFEQFRDWIRTIYQKLTGSPINVKLSDEMRDVFARMLGQESGPGTPETPQTEPEKPSEPPPTLGQPSLEPPPIDERMAAFEARMKAKQQNFSDAPTILLGGQPAAKKSGLIVPESYGAEAEREQQARIERKVNREPKAEVQNPNRGRVALDAHAGDQEPQKAQPDHVPAVGPSSRGGDAAAGPGRDNGAGSPAGRAAETSKNEPKPANRALTDVPAAKLDPPARPRPAAVYDAEDWAAKMRHYGLPDNMPVPTRRIPDELREKLLPGQAEVVEAMLSSLDQTDGAVLAAATGTGKCLAPGTPILMYDGSVKKVEDVVVGDLVMGPDSKPRHVLGLGHGWDEMYRITPVKGDAYTVNKPHILSLVMTNRSQKHYGVDGSIVNISVEDYLGKSAHFKHCAKGYRVGVEFQAQEVPLDPYFLGLWLGDGTAIRTGITNPDPEIIQWLQGHAATSGLKLRSGGFDGRCEEHRTVGEMGQGNPVLRAMRDLNIISNKHVPAIYKVNSRDVRMQVLAGILDTDGHLDCGGYDIIQKSRVLADDILFLARSLGFAAYLAPCRKSCQGGFTGDYFRISISGELSVLPLRVSRKKAQPRKQIKNALRTGIKVEPVGRGEYYGFELDGDGLFLLGDFTVTHNTYIGSAMLHEMLRDGSLRRGLILTPNDSVAKTWREVGAKFGLEIKPMPKGESFPAEDGIYYINHDSATNRETIHKSPWDMVISDESHYGRNWHDDTQRGMMQREMGNNAKKMLYVSATPFSNALEAGYLTKLGLWKDMGWDTWAKQFGIRLDPNSGKFTAPFAPRKLAKLREQLIERGQYINQDRIMKGYNPSFGVVPLTPEQKQGVRNIINAFGIAENYFNAKNRSAMVRAVRGNMATYVKNYIERSRLPQAIELGKQAEAKGHKVIYFSEHRSEVEDLYPFLKEADAGTGGQISKLLPKLPSVNGELGKAFGDKLANFSGSASAARESEKDAFNDNSKQHIFATYAAGGVGVSLHDLKGDAPRLGIYIGLPWSGVMFDQAVGRPWRFGTKSDVQSIFLTSDAENEVNLVLNKIAQRFESLKAGVSGIDKLDPLVNSLNNFDQALDYEFGNEAKTNAAAFLRSSNEAGKIQHWKDIQIPEAKEAIGAGRGMQLPEKLAPPKPASKLYQSGLEPPPTAERIASAKQEVDKMQLPPDLAEKVKQHLDSRTESMSGTPQASVDGQDPRPTWVDDALGKAAGMPPRGSGNGPGGPPTPDDYNTQHNTPPPGSGDFTPDIDFPKLTEWLREHHIHAGALQLPERGTRMLFARAHTTPFVLAKYGETAPVAKLILTAEMHKRRETQDSVETVKKDILGGLNAKDKLMVDWALRQFQDPSTIKPGTTDKVIINGKAVMKGAKPIFEDLTYTKPIIDAAQRIRSEYLDPLFDRAQEVRPDLQKRSRYSPIVRQMEAMNRWEHPQLRALNKGQAFVPVDMEKPMQLVEKTPIGKDPFSRHLLERKQNINFPLPADEVMEAYLPSVLKVIHDTPAIFQSIAHISQIPTSGIEGHQALRELAEGYIRNYAGVPQYNTAARLYQGLSRGIAKVMYSSFLGLNPHFAIVKLGEVIQNTAPEMGAKYTAKGYAHSFTKDGIDLIVRSGLLNDVPLSSNKVIRAGQQVMNAVPYFAERQNRTVAYLAGLEKAKDMGMFGDPEKVGDLSYKRLQELAKSGVDVTPGMDYAYQKVAGQQFLYTQAFDQPIMREHPLVFMFKRFAVKETEMLERLWKERAENPHAWKRAAALLALEGLATATSAAGGFSLLRWLYPYHNSHLFSPFATWLKDTDDMVATLRSDKDSDVKERAFGRWLRETAIDFTPGLGSVIRTLTAPPPKD